jgi:hypothetical protein
MPLERHGAQAQKLSSLALTGKLDADDREAAVHAANIFHLMEDFMEGTRVISLPLPVLVHAEQVYARLIGDNT